MEGALRILGEPVHHETAPGKQDGPAFCIAKGTAVDLINR